MTLRKRNQRVSTPEVVRIRIGIRPRMNGTELHLVLCLQLAELRPQNGGIVRLGEIFGSGGRSDRNVVSGGSLTQRGVRRRSGCGVRRGGGLQDYSAQ